jgi:hypothetical protein
MLGHDVLNAIWTQSSTTCVRKKQPLVAARRFLEPLFQDLCRPPCERSASFLSALTEHPDMGTSSEDQVLSLDSNDFRESKAGLQRQ